MAKSIAYVFLFICIILLTSACNSKSLSSSSVEEKPTVESTPIPTESSTSNETPAPTESSSSNLTPEQQTVADDIKRLVGFDFKVDESYSNPRYEDSIKIISPNEQYVVQVLDKDNLLGSDFPPYLLIDSKKKVFLIKNKELVPYNSMKEQLAERDATEMGTEIVFDNGFVVNGIRLQMSAEEIEKILGEPNTKEKDPNSDEIISTYKDYLISYYNDKATLIDFSTDNLDFGREFIQNYNGMVYKVGKNIYAFYTDVDNSLLFMSSSNGHLKITLQPSDGNFMTAISDGTYKLINKNKEKVTFK